MSTDNFKTIYTFHEIDITENTLVICDIDDTLLRYEVNWDYYFYKFMQEFNNNEIAQSHANSAWYQYTKSNKCFLVDKDGFMNFMNKIQQTDSELIFLTARTDMSHPYTIENFIDIGLDHTKFDIHYSYMKPKGLYFYEQLFQLQNYDHSKYKKIIFIDDALHNILDMNNYLPFVECYFFLGSPNRHGRTTFL